MVWNQGADELLGASPPSVEPSQWAPLYGLYCPSRLRHLHLTEIPWWRVMASREPVEQSIWVVNSRRPVGAWLNVRARPWMSADGEVCGAIATLRELSSSRCEALTHRLLDALYLSGEHAIIGFDERGMIVSWSPGAEKLWGYRPEQILGQATMVLMSPSRLGEVVILRHRLLKNLPIPRLETQIMRGDGVLVPVARTVIPWRDDLGGVAGGVVVLSDLSPRKEYEDKFRERRRQLRELSARIERVREEELLRISREIHDELGQQLTGLRLDLAWLEEKICDVQPELNDRLEIMARLVDDTLRQVRRLSAEMRPPLLDELGLPSAIIHWAEQLGTRSPLVVSVDLQANLAHLKTESSLAIYRMLQEASTNVLRHAEAKHLWVQAVTDAEHLVISVRDDGRGFESPQGAQTRFRREWGSGLGLLGMSERAHLWGGELSVESVVHEGTRVQIRLPWAQIARDGEA